MSASTEELARLLPTLFRSVFRLLAVELDLTGQQIDLVGLANHGLEYFPGG